MISAIKYKQTNYTLWFTALAAIFVSYMLIWKNNGIQPVNFIDGDAEYYYYYLQSTFVKPALIHYRWLSPGSGSFISHHPVGLSLLMLPFFLIAFFAAPLFHYPVDGSSEPFQVAISAAAVFYAVVGLVYLKKLFALNNIPDKVAALVIALVFFGTTLFNYTFVESAMSHVYSFCFMTAFLYYSCRFVQQSNNRDLVFAALMFGIVLLIRPNNMFILLTLFFWFKTKEQCAVFFKSLVKNKTLYVALLIPVACIAFQLITWAVKENNLFTDRYAPYGFSWLHPHFFAMLFGFDNGFFIYTPLCLLFLFGLIPVYRENKFLFYSASAFILFLFYFFSSYSAYTYFDGIGIRVLVDYYSVFALLGAKLLARLALVKVAYSLVVAASLFFVVMSVVYSYQNSRNILVRSGMTFNQWKYIFLRTGNEYRFSLGGCQDLTPYAKQEPAVSLSKTVDFEQPFDFSQKEFGPAIAFEHMGFDSKRIQLKINIGRKEAYINASKDALVCISLEDSASHEKKYYAQFKLNETPSTACCNEQHYSYSFVAPSDFSASDKLSVYFWNRQKQPFFINEFSVNVYNYNYNIN